MKWIRSRPPWFSTVYSFGLAVFVCAGFALSCWMAYIARERMRDYRTGVSQVTSSRTSTNFKFYFEFQVQALSRMLGRMAREPLSPNLWQASAKDFLADYKSFEWMGVLGPDLQYRWEAHSDWFDARKQARLGERLNWEELAKKSVELRSTQVVLLPPGHEEPPLLAAISPIRSGGEFRYLAAILNITRFSQEVIALQGETFNDFYAVALYSGNTALYPPVPGVSSTEAEAPGASEFRLAGLDWRLVVYPKHDRFISSWLPAGILLFGLLATATIAFIWVQLRVARHHRRLAESLNVALEERNERIQLLTDSMAEGILGQDPSGICTFCNAAALRILGYSAESDLLGKSLHELLHRTSEKEAARPLEECPLCSRATEQHLFHASDEVFWRADNSPVPVEFWSHPILHDDQVEGFVTTFLDVTGKKEAEQAIRESKERFELAVVGTNDGVFDWNLVSNVLWYSDRFYELLGYQPREFDPATMGMAQLLHPEDLERTMESMRQHHREGSPYDIEHRLRIKTGEFRWFRSRGDSLRDSNGKPYRTAGSIEDITERRRLLSDLAGSNSLLQRQARELEQKNQEVEAFVYIVSHDLRAPLVNLQGFCRELRLSCHDLKGVLTESGMEIEALKKAEAILDEDIHGSLRFITASTDKFERLITALLRLSRTGRQDYRHMQINMAELAHATFDSVEKLLREKSISAVVGELPSAYGDSTAVGQVLSNLVDNAVKYAKPDQSGTVSITGFRSNGMCHFTVKDTGVGIPLHARGKLFQVFQRFHPGMAQGEGMGLVIVRRIIERHGGEAWMESEEGAGTEFHFTLCADEHTAREKFQDER